MSDGHMLNGQNATISKYRRKPKSKIKEDRYLHYIYEYNFWITKVTPTTSINGFETFLYIWNDYLSNQQQQVFTKLFW